MPEQFTLYSQTLNSLPDEEMQLLSSHTPPYFEQTQYGPRYTYRWTDLTVTCSVMPQEQIAEHLRGVTGYVHQIYGGQTDERGLRIIARLAATSLVVAVAIEPQRDAAGRGAEILSKLTYGLNPIVFFWNSFLDPNGRLLLGFDNTFDPASQLG